MNSKTYLDYVEADGKRWDFWKFGLTNFQCSSDYIRAEILLRLLPNRQAAVVADIGSGDGYLSWLMQSRGDRPLSFDLSFQRLLKTRNAGHARLLAIQANCAEIPLAEASCDSAVLSEIVEHLEAPQAAIREAARILKPGGRLLISVPSAQDAPDVACPRCLLVFNSAGHQQHFEPGALSSLVKSCGLKVEREFTAVSAISRFLLRRRPAIAPGILLIDRILSFLSSSDNLHVFVVATKP
jgi:SAM-dependent methyltransferase